MEITKKELEILLEENKTLKRVSEILGVSKITITKLYRKAGIKINRTGRPCKITLIEEKK